MKYLKVVEIILRLYLWSLAPLLIQSSVKEV